MAFVFQEPRWKYQEQAQLIGPGSYDQITRRRQKLGIITPQKTSLKNKNKQKKTSQLACEIITTQRQNLKVVRTKSKLKKQQKLKKQPTVQQSKSQDVCLEIHNSIQGIRKQFQNNLIKDSFGTIQKNSIHSTSSSLFKKNLFSDKIIRNIDPKSKQIADLTNQCIMPDALQKLPNKKKICKQPYKGNAYFAQNFFSQHGNAEQKQNFIISSGNLKKQSRQIISANNFNSKSSNSNSKNCAFDDFSLTTNIQNESENSFQYFQNATPGPGAYNINKSSLKINRQSKVQEFGVKQNRFKQNFSKDRISFINYQIPNFKKISRASQQKVAFGKSQTKKCHQQKQQMLLYQDFSSIQNKSLKNLIKHRNKQENFLSNCQRFTDKHKLSYNGPDFLLVDEFKTAKPQLPNYIFMSKVDRQNSPSKSVTKEVDYCGQDYYSIQKKMKVLEQNKQIAQIQKPAFLKSQSRFRYPENFQKLGFNKFSKNMTRATSAISSKTSPFSKSQSVSKIQCQTPGPWKYCSPQKWIKESHHFKFKYS